MEHKQEHPGEGLQSELGLPVLGVGVGVGRHEAQRQPSLHAPATEMRSNRRPTSPAEAAPGLVPLCTDRHQLAPSHPRGAVPAPSHTWQRVCSLGTKPAALAAEPSVALGTCVPGVLPVQCALASGTRWSHQRVLVKSLVLGRAAPTALCLSAALRKTSLSHQNQVLPYFAHCVSLGRQENTC